MTRLETLSADLAAMLRSASPAKRRAACIVACELALAQTKVDHPLVRETLRQLRAGHVFAAEQSTKIGDLAARLDEEYFSLQEAAEAGNASDDDYLRAFARARAVAALSFASSDAPDAAAESIYEAATAVGDDQPALLSHARAVLERE